MGPVSTTKHTSASPPEASASTVAETKVQQPGGRYVQTLTRLGFIYIPRATWKIAAERQPSAPFHVTGQRLAVIVPPCISRHSHLTLDIAGLDNGRLQGAGKGDWVGIRIEQLHYTSTEGYKCTFFRRLQNCFHAEASGLPNLQDIIILGNSWLSKANLPLSLRDEHGRLFEPPPKQIESLVKTLSLATAPTETAQALESEDSEDDEDLREEPSVQSPCEQEAAKSETQTSQRTRAKKKQKPKGKKKKHSAKKAGKPKRKSSQQPHHVPHPLGSLSPSPAGEPVRITPKEDSWFTLLGKNLVDALSELGQSTFSSIISETGKEDAYIVRDILGRLLPQFHKYEYIDRIWKKYPYLCVHQSEILALRDKATLGLELPEYWPTAIASYDKLFERQCSSWEKFSTLWDQESSLGVPVLKELTPEDVPELVSYLKSETGKPSPLVRLCVLIIINSLCHEVMHYGSILSEHRALYSSSLLCHLFPVKLLRHCNAINAHCAEYWELLIKQAEPIEFSMRSRSVPDLLLYIINDRKYGSVETIEKAYDFFTLLFSLTSETGAIVREFSTEQVYTLEQRMVPEIDDSAFIKGKATLDTMYPALDFYHSLLEKAQEIKEEGVAAKLKAFEKMKQRRSSRK
ncbi:hypothetical protein [Sansalvadorimonas verongulae]|uniref:hypothetical protein n=1 Tax=Sansalvadorimonas verongulae TaxID=2172824 RepID=UPI0012BC9694|nr:hypothetical protein [Sansalvadorimonas verongulae]MTI12866.1 hypothetical protein [Sansalvadorimonas verongulae]